MDGILPFSRSALDEAKSRRELARWLREAADTIEYGAEGDPDQLVLVLMGPVDFQVIRSSGPRWNALVKAKGCIDAILTKMRGGA